MLGFLYSEIGSEKKGLCQLRGDPWTKPHRDYSFLCLLSVCQLLRQEKWAVLLGEKTDSRSFAQAGPHLTVTPPLTGMETVRSWVGLQTFFEDKTVQYLKEAQSL